MQVADTLREMIMTGELQEGDKINENQLCASMGISKTPLREALRVLSVEGLISLIPNRGSYVTKPTIEEIKEKFEVMTLLESFCARATAEKIGADDLHYLEQLHATLEEKYKSKDQKEYIHTNNQYHSFIQQLAGNRTLNQIVNGLREKILLYRFQSLSLPGRFDASIKEHRELLAAFREKNPQKAERIMKNHLKQQSLAVEKLVKKTQK